MTEYEQGFLAKCAEYGLSEGQSIVLLKEASNSIDWGYVSKKVNRAIALLSGGLRERTLNVGRETLARGVRSGNYNRGKLGLHLIDKSNNLPVGLA